MTYTVPTPSSVNAGDTFPASAYNIISADLQDHESRIIANSFPDSCSLLNTSFSVPDSVVTTITFPTEVFVNGGIHSISTNPTRVTVSKSGIYAVCVNLNFGLNVNGRRVVGINMTGTGSYGVNADFAPQPVTGEGYASAYQLFNAVAGNYFTTTVYQSSGSALTCTARMFVHMIGQKT